MYCVIWGGTSSYLGNVSVQRQGIKTDKQWRKRVIGDETVFLVSINAALYDARHRVVYPGAREAETEV